MRKNQFWRDSCGDAVVEATILFPIIIMGFSAIVLISIYLPQRAILQEAAQVAATAIATARSDTWINFDSNGNYVRQNSQPNIYVKVFQNAFTAGNANHGAADSIVRTVSSRNILPDHSRAFIGPAVVSDFKFQNLFVYQEVVVTVSQTIRMPVNLSFIGFPQTITITQEASAVILDGDEFVRTIDIAKDMILWLDNKLGISDTIKEALSKINSPQIRGIFG